LASAARPRWRALPPAGERAGPVLAPEEGPLPSAAAAVPLLPLPLPLPLPLLPPPRAVRAADAVPAPDVPPVVPVAAVLAAPPPPDLAAAAAAELPHPDGAEAAAAREAEQAEEGEAPPPAAAHPPHDCADAAARVPAPCAAENAWRARRAPAARAAPHDILSLFFCGGTLLDQVEQLSRFLRVVAGVVCVVVLCRCGAVVIGSLDAYDCGGQTKGRADVVLQRRGSTCSALCCLHQQVIDRSRQLPTSLQASIDHQPDGDDDDDDDDHHDFDMTKNDH